MTGSRNQKIILIVLFLLIIYGVGFFQAGWEIRQGERPQIFDLFVEIPTAAHLRTFENDMENGSWFAQTLEPWMRLLQYLALRDTGEKAMQGREGWFFYRPGVKYLIEPLPNLKRFEAGRDPVPAIVDWRDQLAQRGMHLLLIPAPGKASVYPQQLTTRADHANPPVYQHTLELIRQLEQERVEVINLFDLYAGQTSGDAAYLAQDTHWSPHGVQLAAQAIAERLIQLEWIKPGNVKYILRPSPMQRLGDVLIMMSLPLTNRLFQPESVACMQVVREDTGELYQDDKSSPLLILGDSFLRIYERDEPKSAGLISHLAQALSMPLTSIVNDGGASTLVRQELSRKPELLQNKQVVIWEFVERDIRFGTEGWLKVPLP